MELNGNYDIIRSFAEHRCEWTYLELLKLHAHLISQDFLWFVLLENLVCTLVDNCTGEDVLHPKKLLSSIFGLAYVFKPYLKACLHIVY